MAQLIKIKSGSSGAAPGSLLTGEPAYSINDNKLYIGNGSSVVRVDAGSYTAECSTAAATGAKTVNCAGFILFKGVEITIKFTVDNTAAVSELTLNVGGTGAKPIRYRNIYLLSPSTLSANRIYKFYYGGDYWELIGDLDTDTTVGAALTTHTGNTSNPHGTTFANLAGTNPTTISGYGITDAYTETEIGYFFAGTTAISGYNKSNWDTAYGWGNHASAGYAAASALSSHTGNTSNPHSVTKSQVGLGSVENTALSTWAGSTALTTLGTIATGTWNATTIAVAKGGTGKTSIASGKMLYASAANTYAEVTTSAFGRGLLNAVSGTMVTGLNADQIDGYHAAGLWRTDNAGSTSYDWSAKNLTLAGSITGATTITASSTIQATTAKLTNLTDGYLPYHVSDTSGLANSPIYTDGTNVGIGTTSPSQKLDVIGNINIDGSSAYMYDGVQALKLAKGTDTFYANTFVGYNAGNSSAYRQTAVGYVAGNSNTGAYQTALGYYAGQSNSGAAQTAVGYYAGYSNTGAHQTALGYAAGYLNSGAYQTALGYAAGQSNSGAHQTAVGYNAGRENTGDRVIGIGYEATRGNTATADDVVAIGYQAGKDNTIANLFILKQTNINAVPLIQGNFSSGNVSIGSTDTSTYKLYVSGTGHYTSNLSVGGTLGVTGASTLSSARITSAIYFGSSGTDYQINSSGSAKLYDTWVYNLSVKHATPFIDFYFGNGSTVTSRIIEQATGVLDVIGSVKIPDSKYLQIGNAKFTYETVGGVGFLKLAHSDTETPMHLVTTGGQTMYSTGVPASGDGGGSGTLVYLNGSLIASETAYIYAPTTAGSSNNILKSNGSGEPSWVNITSLIPWGGSGSSTMVSRSDHNHGGVYAAASHGHATLFYTELLYTDSYSDTHNVLGYSGTSNYDITLGNDTYKTIINGSPIVLEPFISFTGLVKCTNGTLSIDSNTYLPLSGGTVTGSLSVNTLSITNDSGVSHLAFGRGSYNYITMPASGLLGILPNGQGVGATNGMWFSSSGLHPGTNNTYMVGTSSNRFSQVHATTIYEAGTELSSKYAASSHTHSYLPLSGGSISGNLVVGHATDLNAIRLQTGVMSTNPALGALVASGVFSIVAQETNSFGLHTWVRNTGDTYLQSGRGDANTAAYNIVLNALGGKVGVGMVPTTSFEVAGTVQASADYFTKADYGGFGWKNSSNTVTNYLYLDDDDSYIHFQLGEGLKIDNDVIFTDGIIYGAVVGNYGVCSTASSTAAKTVTIDGFRLATGVQINVKFSNNNSAYPITLNVSDTGAKTIKAYGDSTEQDLIEQIKAGSIIPLVYDGTYWIIPTTPTMY